jgi:hypothetical protein
MTDLKKGDKVLCIIPGMKSSREVEITDVLERTVQVKYSSDSYSNLMTVDRDQVIEKIIDASVVK